MNLKKLAVVFSIVALALVLSSIVSSGNKTQAAVTCSVPTLAYPTIQSAASDPGCTQIDVAPGAYNETVVVNFPTTINGAQVGNNDFVTRSANPAGESTVNGSNPTASVGVFTINATNVTINGFTVKHTVTIGAAMGITVTGSGSNSTIVNNIFDTIASPDTGSQGTAQAIYLTAGGPDNVKIENNEMKNVHSNRSAKGILVGDNGGPNPSQNVQVKGNSIHDITSDTRGAYGLSVASVTNVSGLQVLNNNIDNLTGGGWAHAIGLEGDTPGVIVTGNCISDIVDLTVSLPEDSLAVFFEANPSFGSAEVHQNNFTNVSYGIAVHPALVSAFPASLVDGENNWWGSASGPGPVGPGTGAKVSPGVDYTPWLLFPAAGGACGMAEATNKDQCKNGGWQTVVRANGSPFKNQGDCIQYANTGK